MLDSVVCVIVVRCVKECGSDLYKFGKWCDVVDVFGEVIKIVL